MPPLSLKFFLSLGPIKTVCSCLIFLSIINCAKVTEVAVSNGIADPGSGQNSTISFLTSYDISGITVGGVSYGDLKPGEITEYQEHSRDGKHAVLARSVTEFTNGVQGRTLVEQTNTLFGVGANNVYIVADKKQVISIIILSFFSNQFEILPNHQVEIDFDF